VAANTRSLVAAVCFCICTHFSTNTSPVMLQCFAIMPHDHSHMLLALLPSLLFSLPCYCHSCRLTQAQSRRKKR
jgi:hypothetical protein